MCSSDLLFRVSRVRWAVAFGAAVVAFVVVVIRPIVEGALDASRPSVVTALGLFVGFAALSVAFWGYFRLRGARHAGPAGESEVR